MFINKSLFLDARWLLISCLVVRACDVPTIKKNIFTKRKLFVTVSNLETTVNTALVRVEGKVAKWNQKLDPLYVFPLFLQF